jgi:hypothetical protein
MKKLLLLLTLTLTSVLTTFAKDQGVVEKTVNTVSNAIDSGTQAVKDGIATVDTSHNFSKIYSDVKSGILGLAKALKVGAEHVYQVMVKQQVVNAIASLILVIILLTLSFILYKLTIKTYHSHLKQCGFNMEKPENRRYIDLDDSASGPVSVILAVLSIVCLIAGVIFFATSYNDIIMGLVNPEYGAMKDILNFVTK